MFGGINSLSDVFSHHRSGESANDSAKRRADGSSYSSHRSTCGSATCGSHAHTHRM